MNTPNSPILSLNENRLEHMVDTAPPEQEWIIDGLIPHPAVGILAAQGGTGKSFALLQLAMSVALKRPWLGHSPGLYEKVLYISAEEDDASLHRRISALQSAYTFEHPDLTHRELKNCLRTNMRIQSVVGKNCRLTRTNGVTASPSGVADQLLDEIEESGFTPDLIIFDTLNRFDGGDPNSNVDASILIQQFEKMRIRLDATIIASHHTGKFAEREKEGSPHALRGASAFSDNPRWVGLMRTKPESELKKNKLDTGQWSAVVELTTSKSNYGETGEKIKLARSPEGVLHAIDSITHEDPDYPETIRIIKETIKEKEKTGKTANRNTIRKLAGQHGRFGIGDKKLRSILIKGIRNGDIVEETIEGKRSVLCCPLEKHAD